MFLFPFDSTTTETLHLPHNARIAKKMANPAWNSLGFFTSDDIASIPPPLLSQSPYWYLENNVDPTLPAPTNFEEAFGLRSPPPFNEAAQHVEGDVSGDNGPSIANAFTNFNQAFNPTIPHSSPLHTSNKGVQDVDEDVSGNNDHSPIGTNKQSVQEIEEELAALKAELAVLDPHSRCLEPKLTIKLNLYKHGSNRIQLMESVLLSLKRELFLLDPTSSRLKTRNPLSSDPSYNHSPPAPIEPRGTPCRRCGLCVYHYENTCPFLIIHEDGSSNIIGEQRGRVLACRHVPYKDLQHTSFEKHNTFEYGEAPGCYQCLVASGIDTTALPIFEPRSVGGYLSYCRKCEAKTGHYTHQCTCVRKFGFVDGNGKEWIDLWCGVEGHKLFLRGGGQGCEGCMEDLIGKKGATCLKCGVSEEHKANECPCWIMKYQSGEGRARERVMWCGKVGHRKFGWGRAPGCKDCAGKP